MIQYLKKLVGDYKQAIIANGKLLTVDNRIAYCKKDKHSIVFVSKGRNGDEIVHLNNEEIDTAIFSMLTAYDTDTYVTTEENFIITVCKATNVIVLRSPIYMELSRIAMNQAQNVSAELNDLLIPFLKEELLNYYEVFSRILRPKLSRIDAVLFKAHLVQNLFLPIIVSTNEIHSPLEYTLFSSYLAALLGRTKCLENKTTKAIGLHVYVIAGCNLSDMLAFPITSFSPDVVMLAIISRLCSLFQKQNAVEDLQKRYGRELSTVFPAAEDTTITHKMRTRQEYFMAIQQTPIFKYD